MTMTGTDAATQELLDRFSDAWTAADIDALMDCVTDDCVYSASVGPEPGRTYRGREEVRRGFLAMLHHDRGRERHGGSTLVHGNVAVAEWAFKETTADGGSRLIRGCDIFELADGKIRKKDAFRKVMAGEPYDHE